VWSSRTSTRRKTDKIINSPARRIGKHALLVAARAEIAGPAEEREQVIVAAFRTIHAREPVMRIAAFEEALDDALFEPPLQASLGAQFRQVAIGASVKRARARLARAIHALRRPPLLSLAAS
jgi:hypothetical protein